MKKYLLLVILIFCGILAIWPAAAQNKTLVIEGGTLIDGRGGAPLLNAVIVIEGSRIKAVGLKGKVSVPAGARVIEEDGKTILPGLIDSHIHYRDWYSPMFLHYGVTTIYDTANPTDYIIAQRDMINHGKLKGPRMFVTGLAVDGTPERSDMNSGAQVGGYNAHVTTVEEARALVKSNIAQGVDLIKVHEGLTSELLKSAVDEATSKGIAVVGHSENIREATLSGLKFMEHTRPLARAVIEAESADKLKEIDDKKIESAEYLMDPKYFPPLIKLMVARGVFINPTLSSLWRSSNPRGAEWAKAAAEISSDPGLAFVPEDVRKSWTQPERKPDPKHAEELAEGFKKVQEFVKEYAAAGGKLTAGTDATGYVPGLSLSFEMQSLVDCGATPMQAIVAVTKWAAELAHKEKLFGTVEPGKLADITVIDGDPLKDISAIRNVRLVVKDGEVLDTRYDPKFANPITRTALNGQLKGPDNGSELSSVKPGIAPQADKEITIHVAGKRFSPQSVVRFDDTDLPTQFVSESELTAVISPANQKNVGSYKVTVSTPGAAVSNLRYFIVNYKY